GSSDPASKSVRLEAESERELDLARRAEAHRAADRAGETSEGARGGGRVGLSGLHTVGLGQRRRRNRLRQRADRVGEVRRVEQVEHFPAELEITRAAEVEVLREEEVGLLEAR